MATEKKYLDLTGLGTFKTAMDKTIDKKDSDTLSSAKAYADGLASNYDAAGTAATKVKELADGQVATNKSDIATLKSGKADKATTLSGYGIADAYTKAQTDSAITTAIGKAGHLKREIVSELPAVASADVNTIYMVGKATADNDNAYDEFMLVVSGDTKKFEKIGDSKVDLTNYATKSYADGKASDALTSAKSYSDGLAKNYATAAQGTKADSALQKSSIATGSANGTIAVSGTDVAVKGLGSAAYKAAGSAVGNVPTVGTALGTTANVPVVVTAAGALAPHASGALGSAAFKAASAFDAAGVAETKVNALADGQVATNKTDIATLKSQVGDLQAVTISAISETEINGLFN